MRVAVGAAIPLLTPFIRDVQIKRVKEEIEEKKGIPPEQQQLYFNGRQLCAMHCVLVLLSWLTIFVVKGQQ